MAIAENGPNGPIRGKLGDKVYYILNGQPVVREIGVRTGPRTPQEIHSSARQTALVHFFGPIKEFLKMGFAKVAENTTQNFYNVATSFNRKFAMDPDKESARIDYEKVLLAQGSLMAPLNPLIEIEGGNVRFSWDHDDRLHWQFSTNRTMLLIHFPDTNTSVFKIAGAERNQRTDILHLLPEMNQQTMHIYMAFCASDARTVSDSVYLGQCLPTI